MKTHYNKKRTQTEEHKKKIGLANLGKKRTEENKKKLSDAHKGKKRPPFTEETRRKMSESHRGEKNIFWKGGLTKKNYIERVSIMNTLEYKLWRRSVFERDNYTCIWCGVRGDKLNADHIKSFRDFPELRFAIDNGRTLCEECHKKTDTYGCRTRAISK